MKLSTILSDAVNGLAEIGKNAAMFLSDHRQEVGIITCMTAGIGATATGIHASWEARARYDELIAKKEGEKLTAKEVATEIVLPYYVPTALFTIIEVGSGIFSINEYHRQEAAWMATMELSRNEISELRKWREEAEKKLSIEDKKEVDKEVKSEQHDKIISDAVEAPTGWDCAIWTGHGNKPFIDAITGQKFFASTAWIDACANRIGGELNNYRSADYNEFLNMLCEDSYEKMECFAGGLIGWNVDNGYPTPEYEGKYVDEAVGSVTIVDWSARPSSMFQDRHSW